MFQRSGPDHMLLYTVLKQKGARLNSLSPGRVKVKSRANRSLQRSSLGKNYSLRGNPAPSPTVPLLHCPHGPSMPRFSPPLQMVMVGKGTRTLQDVDVAWWQRLWWWRPSLHRLAGLRELVTPPPTCISRSDASDWLHYDVCALSEFVLWVHSCVWI